METYIAYLGFILILVLIFGFYYHFKYEIDFLVEGLDQGFGLMDIIALWKASHKAGLLNPYSLYVSIPSLITTITSIKKEAEKNKTINTPSVQNLLTKLYNYRKEIEQSEDMKRGLDSTMSLNSGQKLRIIFPGKGVFSSEIINNGRELIITMPMCHNKITVSGYEWIGKDINVYLWRSGDARYVFDTIATKTGVFNKKPVLHLKHSFNLLRTQKRGATRAKCHIFGDLYILSYKHKINFNKVSTRPGYRCLLEDIGEKGLLIRIGGKGVAGTPLRIQFILDNRLIVMYGSIKTVEYNPEINQSRLHFECIHIEESMKNNVLSYVYNIMPEREKEIQDALRQTSLDEKAEKERG